MLIGANSTRLGAFSRHVSGVTTIAGGHGKEAFQLTGRRNNWFAGDHTVSNVTDRSSVPEGARHPIAWLMARKAGGLGSRSQCLVTFAPGTLNLAAGRNIDGSTTVTFALADAQLQLVVSAEGTATFAFTTAGNAAGALFAEGATSAAFTVSTSTLGAIIDAIASTSFAFTPAGTIRADGFMEGNVTTAETLSPASLAAAVWNKAASEANTAGTMGEKLNDAGSASNPWTEVIESGLSAAEVMRLILAFAANNAEGLEGPNPVFKSRDGTKARITATYDAGTRTVTGIDGT